MQDSVPECVTYDISYRRRAGIVIAVVVILILLFGPTNTLLARLHSLRTALGSLFLFRLSGDSGKFPGNPRYTADAMATESETEFVILSPEVGTYLCD